MGVSADVVPCRTGRFRGRCADSGRTGIRVSAARRPTDRDGGRGDGRAGRRRPDPCPPALRCVFGRDAIAVRHSGGGKFGLPLSRRVVQRQSAGGGTIRGIPDGLRRGNFARHMAAGGPLVAGSGCGRPRSGLADRQLGLQPCRRSDMVAAYTRISGMVASAKAA